MPTQKLILLCNVFASALLGSVLAADKPATQADVQKLQEQVRAGQVFINNYGAGGGVELPFGGVQSSWYGREKGFEALLGCTVLKTVAVKHG